MLIHIGIIVPTQNYKLLLIIYCKANDLIATEAAISLMTV